MTGLDASSGGSLNTDNKTRDAMGRIVSQTGNVLAGLIFGQQKKK